MKLLSDRDRLLRIAEILERVDGRCLASDGPVTQTKEEISGDELREIYTLASGAATKDKRKTPFNATFGVRFGPKMRHKRLQP